MDKQDRSTLAARLIDELTPFALGKVEPGPEEHDDYDLGAL